MMNMKKRKHYILYVVVTSHVFISFIQCSGTAQEILRYGFRYLFRCLGKHLEQQRRDRDQYIQILRENINPGYIEHAVDSFQPFENK